jgi:hypothetical protein
MQGEPMNQRRQVPWPSNLVIKRNIQWEDGPEDRAVLLVPRFRKGFLAKYLQPRLKKPYMRVKLDDIGTFVWKRCDGNTDLEALARLMRDEFGEKIEPAAERLQQFLTILKRSQFVELYKPTE